MTRIRDFGQAEADAHNAKVRGATKPVPTLRQEIAAKRSKFGNTKVYYDRIEFDSEGERDRYIALRLLETAHLIKSLVVHPAFPLFVDGVRIGTYKADFRYIERGEEVIEDYKSKATAKLRPFMRNVKHVEAQYGVVVKVIMK